MPYEKQKPLEQPSAIQANTDLLKNVSKGANTLYTGLRTGVVPKAAPAATPGVIGSFNKPTPTPADTGIRGRTIQQSDGQGLRSPLQDRPQYDANFARQSKRILAKRGLTRAQRKSQLGALQTAETMRQYGVDPAGEQGKQIADLSREANRKGLTASMRSDLLGLSNDILDNAIEPAKQALKKSERNQGDSMSFEDALLKKLDSLDGG